MPNPLNRQIIRRMIISEMKNIIQDDALFTQREIPGDADDVSASNCGCKSNKTIKEKDCGCGTKRSNISTMIFKRGLYDMIDNAIAIYDAYDDVDQVSADLLEKISNISKDIEIIRRSRL